MFKKTKKYSCSFCNDLTEISKNKVSFCRDCIKIRSYIREYGLKSLLEKITQNEKITYPPNYNT